MKQYKLEFGEEEKKFNNNEFIPEPVVEINSGHYLELMDRLHIIMQNLNDHAIEHPLSSAHEPIKDLLVEALDIIFDAYQTVGNLEQTK